MADPTKYDLVSYLAGITSILTEMDKSGSVNRSTGLGAEYTRAYAQLKELIDKEQENAKEKK